jgi:hypothetical protein
MAGSAPTNGADTGVRDMASTMIRYKVHPDRADENVALVKAVYEELAQKQPDGLRYATFVLPDGVTFMHLVIDTEQPGRILGEIAAFTAFQAEIESRCEEPPAPMAITLVGSYGVGARAD